MKRQEVPSHMKSKKDSRRWPDWYPALATYRYSDNRKALRQLVNTLIPYACLWYLMTRLIQLGQSYWVTLMLAVPAGGFLVRLFILFHDCVHGSFFRRQGANTFFGHLIGVLVFTSFEEWRFTHLRHHTTHANLDERGFGDIWTMTATEYATSSKKKQWQYRLYRNPLVMIGLGALFTFLIANRLPTGKIKRKQRTGVYFTNLMIILLILVADRFIGWRTYLAIQLPVFWFAGAAGVWLFYVQHQFQGGYWARKGDWHPLRAAMEGSSFYKMPIILRWFSGNIGYHHVHHLSPRIPNYHLKKCYDTFPELQAKVPLTLRSSLSCVHLKVWDEKLQMMTAFPSKNTAI